MHCVQLSSIKGRSVFSANLILILSLAKAFYSILHIVGDCFLALLIGLGKINVLEPLWLVLPNQSFYNVHLHLFLPREIITRLRRLKPKMAREVVSVEKTIRLIVWLFILIFLFIFTCFQCFPVPC